MKIGLALYTRTGAILIVLYVVEFFMFMIILEVPEFWTIENFPKILIVFGLGKWSIFWNILYSAKPYFSKLIN